MKDYLIWLSSGECIEGTAKESILKDLQQRFKDKSDDIVSFSDTDGEVTINMNRVEAMAINNQLIENEAGFKNRRE